MQNVKEKVAIRDYLLCLLPILAYVSMQYRTDITLLNASLIATACILIFIWVSSYHYFTTSDLMILLICVSSLCVTLIRYKGLGVSLNYINLLLCLMIFNKVPFAKKTISIVRVMLIVGILIFFITSSLTMIGDWAKFYDKNGSLVNNNTVSLILVALYVYLSSILVGVNKPWAVIVLLSLLVLFMVLVNVFGCRSAMFFFVVYIVLGVFHRPILKNDIATKKTSVVLLLSSIAITLIYLFLSTKIGNFNVMGKSFFSGRETVWSRSYSQILDHPIFGSGTAFSIDYAGGSMESSHNMLLGLWRNLGLIPFVSIFVFYFIKGRTKIEKSTLIAILAFVIIACFESFLMDARLYLLFLLAFPGTRGDHYDNSTKGNDKRGVK